MESHFATVFEALADTVGDAPALVQGTTRRTWQEMDDRAARIAAALVDAGAEPGDKVAQFLYNSPAYLESWYGTLKARCVPVNVNYRYVDDELSYLLENAEASALVFHASLAERVARVAPGLDGLRLLIEVDDSDIVPTAAAGRVPEAVSMEALLSGFDPAPRITRDPADITMTYTGGTTGLPKGVMSTIGPAVDGLLVSVPPALGRPPLAHVDEIPAVAAELCEAREQFGSLPACPLMHATGLGIGALPTMTFGGRIVLLEQRGLDADELWATVERESVNGIAVVGDAFARPMVASLDAAPGGRDLSSMKLILSSGAMFSAESKTALLGHIPQLVIIDYIAATEGMMGSALAMNGTPVETGRFTPAPNVVVLDDDDTVIEPGADRTGVVAIGGTSLLGYYKDEGKTAETFRTIDGVRYSIPGDFAQVRADGSIQLLGRGSQCINTGGEKVYPEEVEEAIKRHDGIADCLVFGVADERFGQRVVGVASLDGSDPEVTPERAIDGARASLSAYKLPRTLQFVDLVPRAPNGKADYPSARALFRH